MEAKQSVNIEQQQQAIYPGRPGWASTRTNIHSLTPSLKLLYNIFN